MAMTAEQLRKESYARRPGSAGFSARASITDDLITRGLEKDRLSKEKIASGRNVTALQQAQIGAESRSNVARIGAQAGLEQEGIRQTGTSARQELTLAGSRALQELQGSQSLRRQQAADVAAGQRITGAGEQTRKTAKKKSDLERADLDYILEKYGISALGASRGNGYSYDGDTDDETDGQYIALP